MSSFTASIRFWDQDRLQSRTGSLAAATSHRQRAAASLISRVPGSGWRLVALLTACMQATGCCWLLQRWSALASCSLGSRVPPKA